MHTPLSLSLSVSWISLRVRSPRLIKSTLVYGSMLESFFCTKNPYRPSFVIGLWSLLPRRGTTDQEFLRGSTKAGLRFIKTRLLRGCSTRGDEAINLVRYLIDLVEKAVIMVKKGEATWWIIAWIFERDHSVSSSTIVSFGHETDRKRLLYEKLRAFVAYEGQKWRRQRDWWRWSDTPSYVR